VAELRSHNILTSDHLLKMTENEVSVNQELVSTVVTLK